MLFWCIILSLPDTRPRVCTRETLPQITEKNRPTTSVPAAQPLCQTASQMQHANIVSMHCVLSTHWDVAELFSKTLAIDKLDMENRICNRANLPPRTEVQAAHVRRCCLPSHLHLPAWKKRLRGDNCADATCHFFKLYYRQTVSMLVCMLKLQLKNFLSNLPIREESVKWRSNEWRRDCFNLWKTETFPLEVELFRRTMKAASDSTLKRAELILASLLAVWKLHSPNSGMSFSRRNKSLSLYSTHFHKPTGKNKVLKAMWTTLHLTKHSMLNNSI